MTDSRPAGSAASAYHNNLAKNNNNNNNNNNNSSSNGISSRYQAALQFSSVVRSPNQPSPWMTTKKTTTTTTTTNGVKESQQPQPRWKAFPATTAAAGVPQPQPTVRSSVWKNNNNNNNTNIVTAVADSSSRQSMPSTEIASNIHPKQREPPQPPQPSPPSAWRAKQPAAAASPSSRGTAAYLAPSASWIKPASPSRSSASGEEGDDISTNRTHSRTAVPVLARSSPPVVAKETARWASPPPSSSSSKKQQQQQQQPPLWKQQLLKQRQDQMSQTPPSSSLSSPSRTKTASTVNNSSNNKNSNTTKMTSPAAASIESESESETTTPRTTSLVSERLAKFSGNNNKAVVRSPTRLASSSSGQKPYSQKPVVPPQKATPPRAVVVVVDEPQSPRRMTATTTTPSQTTTSSSSSRRSSSSRYVPPPTQHSFVPLVSSSSVRSTRGPPNKTLQQWTPSPVQHHPTATSSSSSRHHPAPTHLDIVPQPPVNNNNSSSNWVSPRTNVESTTTTAARSTPRPPPQKRVDVAPADNPAAVDVVQPIDERGFLETPGKMSVKDMKAKLWSSDGGKGGVAQLKTTTTPPVVRASPKMGTVRTFSQRTATTTTMTHPSSPPSNRIAKGLIDVATPQGLTPPWRSTPQNNNNNNLTLPLFPTDNDDADPPVRPPQKPVEKEQPQPESGAASAVESDGTGPGLPLPPPWNGRSFRANVASVLAPRTTAAGSSSSRRPSEQPWLQRRRDVPEEKKSREWSPTTERSLNEGFDLPPSRDVSLDAAALDAANYHSRSTSIGDFQIEGTNNNNNNNHDGSAADHGNVVSEPLLAPTTPPPSEITERPLSGRPSSDEPDSPPLQMSMSPSHKQTSSTEKPPLSPTAPLHKRNSFVETIDCPPSDDLGDEEKKVDAAATAPDDIYAERLPMTPSRGETQRPWSKDANTLSPASWQKRTLLEDNVMDHGSSSRENVAPVKSNAVQPESESFVYTTPPPTAKSQEPLEPPGSTLLQMAADSIHALDFEQVRIPKPTLSEDGSESLLSNNTNTNAVTTNSVPANVPPEFRQTVSEGAAAGAESLPSDRKSVADRARALAQWNGGLGEPLRPDDEDDEEVEEQEDVPELSPIRPQGSDSGFFDEAMSPRLNHRGTALDDWQENKSFNSSRSFAQTNSDFNVPQFDDSMPDDKDWSIDENDQSVDPDPFGVAPPIMESYTTSASEDLGTVTTSSSVKPIGKPRRDSEPRKQKKDRRKNRMPRAESPAVHKVEEEKIMVDKMANGHEEEDYSTTFDFDPFAVDGCGDKIEFTETTEFTEGSDFFGTAATAAPAFGIDFFPQAQQLQVSGAPPLATDSKDTATTRSSLPLRTGDSNLHRVDTDFWSYEADISTFHEEENNTHHIEI